MASHIVGNFRVEFLHRRESLDKKLEVIVLVFSGEKFLDYGRFTRLAFNSAKLRDA